MTVEFEDLRRYLGGSVLVVVESHYSQLNPSLSSMLNLEEVMTDYAN